VEDPEMSTNKQYEKTKAIAIDTQTCESVANNIFQVKPEFFAMLAVMHGVGHNASLNHSDENSRHRQTTNNARIMLSGRAFQNNPSKFWYNLIKSSNKGYIKMIEERFGTKKAKVNYPSN